MQILRFAQDDRERYVVVPRGGERPREPLIVPIDMHGALHSPEWPVSKGGKQWVTKMYIRDK